MTDEKKSKNPFINMANAAKKTVAVPGQQPAQGKAPKPSKGFGGASVVRRTGRGR
ncbi:MAG: hypothetical protein ACOVLB_04880 [Candidatus Nanopelagicus sp.]